MNLSGRNLSSNSSGPDVTVLQTELARLGYALPANETASQQFGPATLDAVRDFQRRRGVPVTGVVDPPSARLINLAVESMASRRFTVSGAVRHQDGTILPGLRVRVFDKDMRAEQQLGEAVTDRSGRYE